jgi:hypothetical protein
MILVRREPGVNAGPITASRKMPVNGHQTLRALQLLHPPETSEAVKQARLCVGKAAEQGQAQEDSQRL